VRKIKRNIAWAYCQLSTKKKIKITIKSIPISKTDFKSLFAQSKVIEELCRTNNKKMISSLIKLIESDLKQADNKVIIKNKMMSDFATTELRTSIAHEILAEHLSHLRVWLQSGGHVPYYPLELFTNKLLLNISLEQKNKPDTFINQRNKNIIKEKNDEPRKYRENEIISLIRPTVAPKTATDRITDDLAFSAQNTLKLYQKLCNNLRKTVPRKIVGKKTHTVIQKLENALNRELKANVVKTLKESTYTASVWLLAKNNTIPFKKLLHALQSLRYPLHQRKDKNKGCWVTSAQIDELEQHIIPLIKQMYYCKTNRKRWISFFQKYLYWEKSRISQFMKRRVKDGTVMFWFFDNCPPSKKLMVNLLDISERKKLSKFLFTHFPDRGFSEKNTLTCNGIKKILQERFSPETLLTDKNPH